MISYTSIIPLITKAIFDDALAQKDTHLFVILLCVLVVGLFCLILLWLASDILQALIGVKITNDIRLGMFKKIHYLSHINYRQNIPGDLLRRFENCSMVTYVLMQVACGAIGSSGHYRSKILYYR